MSSSDKHIDHYIANAQEFAKPILEHLRAVVHKACPDVDETIKWGFPHFEYGGKILCGMAAFKRHCAFLFRLGARLSDPEGILQTKDDKNAMGHFGQIKDLKNLPSQKILIRYIKEAMALTDKGEQPARPGASQVKELQVPAEFLWALKKNRTALANFESFSFSNKKEYVQWIAEAKTSETRARRIATAVEWLNEGKARNWKYT